jgi:hypothetical protein
MARALCNSLSLALTLCLSVSKYCSKMAGGGVWGGGIEMAALSHSRRVNVHVYQVSSVKRMLPFIDCVAPYTQDPLLPLPGLLARI